MLGHKPMLQWVSHTGAYTS